MVPFLKKTLKAITWLAIGLLLLVVVLAILIRLPSVQRKITGFAVSYITGKTHTAVRAGEIAIVFPKSVTIKDLFIGDQQNDTLLSAETIKLNLRFKDLLRKNINIRSLSLQGATLSLNRTAIDSLFNFNFLLTAFADTAQDNAVRKDSVADWKFAIGDIILKDILLDYDDAFGNLNVSALCKNIKLKMDRIDLARSVYKINDLQISGSWVTYNDYGNHLTFRAGINSIQAKEASLEFQDDWKVTAKSIGMDDNSFEYGSRDSIGFRNNFNTNHLDLKYITLEASDILVTDAKKSVSVRNFSAIDQNNFTIKKFETEFSMDLHSITARRLRAETANSSFDGDLMIGFSSIQALADSIPDMVLSLDIHNASVMNSDITYFSRALGSQPFFLNAGLITTISGKLSGPVNNITGKGLVIKTGTNTTLETDCKIFGLPEFQTMRVDFPNLKLSSCSKDIRMLAGQYIPENLDLPESITASITFNGKLKSFNTNLQVTSSFGNATVSASIDNLENFYAKAGISQFDLGRLLKNSKMFGPVTAVAEISGRGLDKNTIHAKIKGEISHLRLNAYDYHHLSMQGNLSGQEFDGTIQLKDENALFDFSGLVNIGPGQERYTFKLNLEGADLQKLNLSKTGLAVGLVATIDLKGGSLNKINGLAAIRNIVIVREGKKYTLDSLVVLSINGPEKNEVSVSSAIIDVRFTGAVSPISLPSALVRYLNGYFPFSEAEEQAVKIGMPSFYLEMQVHNHPIISEVILPQLKVFEEMSFVAGYDTEKQELSAHALVKNMVYGTTGIKDLEADIKSELNGLKFRFSSLGISNQQIRMDNLLFEGTIADRIISANLSSIDEKLNKKILIRSVVTKQEDGLRIAVDPDGFFLMNDRWDIAADNYLVLGKKGFYVHNFILSKSDSKIEIASAHDRFNDDLNIGIMNFNLEELSRIVTKDTVLVKGRVDGGVLLKRINKAYGIIADAKITNLIIRNVPVGDVNLKAGNPESGKIEVEAGISGHGNNLEANGYFLTGEGENSIRIDASVQSLSLATVQAFSLGQITEASGNLSGNFLVTGNMNAPDITGKLVFNDALFKPAVLNSLLGISNQTIEISNEGINFKSFTISDKDKHVVTIDGTIHMKKFRNLVFDLKVDSRDFLLANTTAKDNREFNGRMVVDSKIDIQGSFSHPVVNAKIKIKKGSNFTFAVPESRLTTDKGEGIVEFSNSATINPILLRAEKKEIRKSVFRGIDISSIIEVDKDATLRLLMDPASADSLVVKGEAALSFTLDKSGMMSLTGAYNLTEGSYLVSLESVIKKKFNIVPGSTIIWSGDPLDAEISINATYSVQASPYDLVYDQMSGLSDADKGGYKNRYPFLVYLKLRGEMLHPQISFDIQLAPEDKGILGGVVNQKLIMLNEDESALNKQVFALLVLGRFIQENPLVSESGGTSSLVRSTVGKFLSAQLNQLSSKVVPGMEINFDIQSYEDYQSGQAQGRTQVEVGLKKQLFNERLSIEVGGAVDVEGEKARQNTASDITGDVTVEFKITEDGRYRLKAFRHNQYEGAIEGQLVETGAGILFQRDFNKWRELFIRQKKTKAALKPEQLP